MHDRRYAETAQSAGDWKAVLELLPYLKAFKWRILLAFCFLVGAKLSNVLVPVLLKHIVDALDKSHPNNQAVDWVAVPVAMVIAYGFFRFSSVFFNELRDAVFGRVAERTLSNVGLAVFRHLHKLDLEFHLSRRTGGLSRDIERGTNGISFLLRSIVFSVLPIFLEIIMVCMVMLWNFDVSFVLVMLIAVISYVVFSVKVTHWRTEFVRAANRKDSQANTQAIDSLLNYETVKYFGNEQFEADRYQASLREREDAKVKNHLSLAALNSGQALIIAGSITWIMLMAAGQVAEGRLSLGDLAMVNAFMIQLFVPLNILGFVYREIRRSLADVEDMMGLLDVKPAIEDRPDAKVLPEDADGIEFSHVYFSYHPDRPILQDISFSVAPGEKVAIVGASGAGKSTIARLLYRFYDVDHGSVAVGGYDVREVTQDSLRRAIGVVPQDTVLFNDTLYENLRYGKPSANRQEIERAVELAYLKPFIEKLPEGLQTKVGERGLKVSGGEKQRIAIARTILKKPRILVFDEATSSLDSVSEQAILQALKKIAERHTTVVIAHRLSTIVDADKILVLQDGRLVEKGDHETLLQMQGLYHRLWQVQKQHEADR